MNEPEEKTYQLEDLIPSHTIELSPAARAQFVALLANPSEPPPLARQEARAYIAKYGLPGRLTAEERPS